MGNQKSKPTGTIHLRTTTSESKPQLNNAAVPIVSTAVKAASDPDTSGHAIPIQVAAREKEIEETATSIESIAPASPTEVSFATTLAEGANPAGSTSADSKPEDSKTKMDIATEIFKKMKKIKGTSRKDIIHQFVLDAKLSKAGASTYYQLIKAKLGDD